MPIISCLEFMQIQVRKNCHEAEFGEQLTFILELTSVVLLIWSFKCITSRGQLHILWGISMSSP